MCWTGEVCHKKLTRFFNEILAWPLIPLEPHSLTWKGKISLFVCLFHWRLNHCRGLSTTFDERLRKIFGAIKKVIIIMFKSLNKILWALILKMPTVCYHLCSFYSCIHSPGHTLNIRLCGIWFCNVQGAAKKSSPLTFFAVFSATAWNLNAKFYTHV